MENHRVNDVRRLEFVRLMYMVFSFLAAIDIALIASSEEMRNALGRVDDRGWVLLASRVLPSVILLSFYSWFLSRAVRSIRLAAIASGLHSAIFSVLGLVALVPGLGLFAAALTPISVVYVGAILWLPGGYFAAVLVALVFIAVNLGVGNVARRAYCEYRALRDSA